MSGWVDLQFFFVSRSFTTSPDFLTYLLLFPRMSGWVDLKFFSRISLVDFRSEFWHWKWPPERKGSPTRVLANIFFHISLSWPLNRGLTPKTGFDPKKGHPKWSPGRILANIFSRISLSWPQNRILTLSLNWPLNRVLTPKSHPKTVTPSGHPVKY